MKLATACALVGAAVASASAADSAEAASASSRGLRSSCANDFHCGANAYRIPDRQCYNSFDDCACDHGYQKVGGKHCLKPLKLRVNNLSYQQPFSDAFLMVHAKDAERLYEQGKPASHELATLAEDGDPSALAHYFHGKYGVLSATQVKGPIAPGGYADVEVWVNDAYDRVTLATMAINTNDCFAAVNGKALKPGDVLNLPGLDAGSEENNELCSSIPGPACASGSGNVRSRNGEGYVHVHRGFHGVNEGKHLSAHDNGANGKPLSAAGYDWRNPLMRVTVSDGEYH